MKDVIIIGAGGHAAEIDEYIIYSRKVTGIKTLNVIGFLDDSPENYSRYKLSAPLLGGPGDHQVIRNHAYIICIANLKFRRLFFDKYRKRGKVCLFHSFHRLCFRFSNYWRWFCYWS
jgi:hypothetical protein